VFSVAPTVHGVLATRSAVRQPIIWAQLSLDRRVQLLRNELGTVRTQGLVVDGNGHLQSAKEAWYIKKKLF